jgi:hypothetical protein
MGGGVRESEVRIPSDMKSRLVDGRGWRVDGAEREWRSAAATKYRNRETTPSGGFTRLYPSSIVASGPVFCSPVPKAGNEVTCR